MFCQKQMRCHHLDRKDQVDSYEQSLCYQQGALVKLAEEVRQKQQEYAEAVERIERTKHRIEDLKATLHIHWIECDDLPW